jgi:hypothetical protein
MRRGVFNYIDKKLRYEWLPSTTITAICLQQQQQHALFEKWMVIR